MYDCEHHGLYLFLELFFATLCFPLRGTCMDVYDTGLRYAA